MSGPGARVAGPKPSSKGCHDRTGKPFPRLLHDQRPGAWPTPCHRFPAFLLVIAAYLGGGRGMD